MSGQIFISYRRDDAAYVTGHINDLLRKEFGDDAVFTDVDNIALGVDFRAVLDQTVSQCQVFLAVIGSEWLTVRDHDGRPRIQDPADFVRIEIESALNRNIPVIPLLVAGATMPAAEDLPESLRELAFRNGTQIRPAPDFGVDMARLIKNLQRHFTGALPEDRGDPVEEPSPAKTGSQPKSRAAQAVRVEVGAQESARRRAELGIESGRHKRRLVRGLALVAIVLAAGASWYFWEQNQETMPAAVEQVPEAIDDVVADSVAESELPDDLEITTPDVALEPEAEVGPPEELVADETGEQPDAIAEIAIDAVANEPTIDEAAAPETEPVLEPETEPKLNPAALIGEGVRLAAIEDHEGAIENFTGAIELDSEQAFVFRQRGTSYQAIGQFEAAIADYDEAIRLNSEDLSAYFNRGVSHHAIQDYEAAIADFGAVIELDPGYTDAFSRRADAHEAVGDMDAAARDRADIAWSE